MSYVSTIFSEVGTTTWTPQRLLPKGLFWDFPSINEKSKGEKYVSGFGHASCI